MKKVKVGIIGTGNMGQAIIKGLGKDKRYEVSFFEIDPKKANMVSKKYKIKKNNFKQLTNQSNIIIICVKPQVIDQVLLDLKPNVEAAQLIVSIAAGVTLKKIENTLGRGISVMRVMPNMPAMIGQGISAYCLGRWARKADQKHIENIFSKLGQVIKVKNSQMDAITAVTGSGPGFIAYLTDGLIKAAVKAGFDKKTATLLSLKTLRGTINLIDQSGINPEQLVKKVASKGGTTEAGLKVLNQKKTKTILEQTIKQAASRAKELSK
jgi:pyrroline-5-carboxylate reductase